MPGALLLSSFNATLTHHERVAIDDARHTLEALCRRRCGRVWRRCQAQDEQRRPRALRNAVQPPRAALLPTTERCQEGVATYNSQVMHLKMYCGE